MRSGDSLRPAQAVRSGTVEAHLESMLREPRLTRADELFAHIRQYLSLNQDPAPWIAAARSLSDRGIITENTFYYLVEQFTECLVPAPSTPAFWYLHEPEELGFVSRGDYPRQDVQLRARFESPDRVDEEFARYRRRIRVAPQYLRTHGHAEVASLLESNLEEFERRADAGADDLWNSFDADSDE